MATQVSPELLFRSAILLTHVSRKQLLISVLLLDLSWRRGWRSKINYQWKESGRKFGKPTDDNFEYWFTASEFLNYGGNLQVARIADASGSPSPMLTLLGWYCKGQQSFRFWANIEATNQSYDFVAKTPGTWGNSLKVVTIDAGADQILTLASGVALAKVMLLPMVLLLELHTKTTLVTPQKLLLFLMLVPLSLLRTEQ